MLNLIQAIKEIQEKIDKLIDEKDEKIKEITQKYEEEIQKYNNALSIIRELNEACEYCEGKGKVYVKDDSSDPYNRAELMDCPVCLGTGKKPLKIMEE
jgi:RecJ-like exonuclease